MAEVKAVPALPHVQITLDPLEAATLTHVMGLICGDESCTRARITGEIYDQLYALGYRGDGSDHAQDIKGNISFTAPKWELPR